jgi:hypothetical protein
MSGGYASIHDATTLLVPSRGMRAGLSLGEHYLANYRPGTSPPAGWSPPTIAGLLLEFCADLATYSDTGLTVPQTTNNGNVLSWGDQSGGAHNAIKGGAGTSPTLKVGTENGRNGIAFLNQWFATASITAPTGDFSFIVVWRPVSNVTAYNGVLTRDNGATGGLYQRVSTKMVIWNGSDVSSSANMASAESLLVTTFVRSSTSGRFWKNGTADALNPVSMAGTLGSPAAFGIAADVNGGEGSSEVICAIFVYDNAISGADRIALHTFLGSYYGIAMGGN